MLLLALMQISQFTKGAWVFINKVFCVSIAMKHFTCPFMSSPEK